MSLVRRLKFVVCTRKKSLQSPVSDVKEIAEYSFMNAMPKERFY